MSSESARYWLARAKGNLARASQSQVPGTFLEDYCFDAQQAVEKALKSILVARGIRPPRVHDLAEILTMFRERNIEMPPESEMIARLTPYAVEARYSGADEPVTELELEEVLAIATRVVKWCDEKLDLQG